MSCSVPPLPTPEFAGVTAMETSVAAVTVNEVEPDTPLKVAVMVLVPAATALANPAVLMVATLVVPEVQVTFEVRTCFELSE